MRIIKRILDFNTRLAPRQLSLLDFCKGKSALQATNLTAAMTTTNNTSKAQANDTIETCKSRAAWAAVDDHVNRDCIVGIGSGTTMRYVLERLKYICQEKNLTVKCIPTSFQSKQLIYDFGLPLAEVDGNPIIDVTIDGADEVDKNFVAIKGGGACLAQEKVIAFAARKFIIVADYRKDSRHLCDNWTKGIPIEVLPMASNVVRHHMAEKYKTNLDDLQVRIGREKAGPVITDNGNFVIDWKYERTGSSSQTAEDWKQLSNQIKVIPGVVETGIFAGMVSAVYFGQEDGSVLKKFAGGGDS